MTISKEDFLPERVRYVGDTLFFTLKVGVTDESTEHGATALATIYDCRLVTAKDGSEFISFPQHKGKDGQWYNSVYVDLMDEEKDYIIKLVQALAPDKPKKEVPARRGRSK